jgi:hypothetical protein
MLVGVLVWIDQVMMRTTFKLFISPKALKLIAKLKQIKTLYFSGCKRGFHSESLQHLTLLPKLSELNLKGLSISKKKFQIIAKIPNLKILNLIGSTIVEKNLEFTLHIPHVSYFPKSTVTFSSF